VLCVWVCGLFVGGCVWVGLCVCVCVCMCVWGVCVCSLRVTISFLLENLAVISLLNKFSPTVAPDGSFPCTQQPTNGPYPEPDHSGPHPSKPEPSPPITSIYNDTPNCFPKKFFCLPSVLHVLPISSSLVRSPK